VERLDLDADGVASETVQISSPNQDERPDGEGVNLLVIHNISLPPGKFGGDAIIQFFTNRLDFDADPYYEGLRGLKVAPHFLIRRDGTLLQFVPCGRRAWHAGASAWKERTACNDFSIGVELEGTDDIPYAEEQYAALARLTRMLRRRYPIEDIAGHSDIAPGRKTDPGPAFDWGHYRALLARGS